MLGKKQFLRSTCILAIAFVALLSAVRPHSIQQRSAGPQIEQGYLTAKDGVRLFYRKLGQGPDFVIFLHGGPGLSMHDGGFSMDPLAANHTLIMYDQRGGGRSELVKEKALLTAADDVRDLEAVREHFGIKTMMLIGLSWGSGLAALYADAHPDRVSRIVFLDPMPIALTPFARERSEKIASIFTPADATRLKELEQQEKTASDDELLSICREEDQLSFKPYLFDLASYDRNRGDACDDPPAAIRNISFVSNSVVSSLGDFDLRPLLARLRVPVLVIEGEKTNVPLDSTREWAGATPGARLLLLPNAGHATFIDQPEALIRNLQIFLGGRWPRAPK